MTQLNRIHLTSQTPNNVEITKIVKVELLTASACLEYVSSETNKIHCYKIGFLHVYKLTTYLISPAKSLPLQ